jgi:peptide/nickel transport system substrate-binding protein
MRSRPSFFAHRVLRGSVYALVIGVQLFIAAASGAADLRLGLSADVTTIDPHFVAAQPNLTVGLHIFEGLVRIDERGRVQPGLAESWSTPDPRTWQIRLRRGVKFHDGSELAAEDVVFSLERPLTIKGSPGGFASYVRPIVAKEIVDAHTLRLRTAVPYGPLLQDLAHVLIVSRRAAGHASSADFDSGKAAIGTGPYRYARFTRGDRVQLVRHDGYWGGRPQWDNVTLRILPADPVRTASLLSGDLDAIESVPSADLARLRKSSALRLAQAVSWRTILLHLDQYRAHPPGVADRSGKPLGSNPFRDARVRLALSKAINRQALVDRVLEGLGVPAGNVTSPSVIGHDPAVKPDGYDPEGARRLLAEAGYPNGFSLTLAAPNNRYINDEQVAQACAQFFSRIGVATRIEAMPLAAYLGKVRGEGFGVALLGWGSLAADLALRSLAVTPDPAKGYGAWNWARYSDPKLDALVEQSLSTVDPARREIAARAASARAAHEHAFIPLYYQVATWAMKRSIDYVARTDEFTLAQYFKPAAAAR